MQKFTLIILLLIFNLTFGQDKNDPTESLIAEFKSEMKKENTSDFFMVKHITYGSARIIDLKDPNSCNENGYYFTMYGFWNNGKDSYIKKFDNCGEFNSIKLSDSRTIDFYKKNVEMLKSEKVKSYQLTPDSLGKDGLVYKSISSRTHQPLRYFWFFQDSTEFKNDFDKYNLETEEDKKNLNYESNNNLSIVKLNLICEEIIYGLEEKKMFNRLK
jgi:hypothetical protein